VGHLPTDLWRGLRQAVPDHAEGAGPGAAWALGARPARLCGHLERQLGGLLELGGRLCGDPQPDRRSADARSRPRHWSCGSCWRHACSSPRLRGLLHDAPPPQGDSGVAWRAQCNLGCEEPPSSTASLDNMLADLSPRILRLGRPSGLPLRIGALNPRIAGGRQQRRLARLRCHVSSRAPARGLCGRPSRRCAWPLRRGGALAALLRELDAQAPQLRAH
jgi:hypothetical protein